ncbi:kinase-like domain-containing protein [Phascolomyces articulosus]|uniref:Kinase-like domain-containing protein n=1 Tax=Phascolomyces articulosus TaxID=60185 RepID=A0AAD5JYJ3_9FUNG|nr:kinase-like domain-containing protein [Phascolomyces articulosus]
MPLRTVADQLRTKLRRRQSQFLPRQQQQEQSHSLQPSQSPPVREDDQRSIASSRRSYPRQYNGRPITPTPPTPPPPPPPPPPPHSSKKKKYPPSTDTLIHGIGNYNFLEQIGHGKFSVVMLAEHYITGERFAIKIIDKREHEYRVMSRLVREVTLMELIDHKNVIHLYETYETAETLYLVMEYVPGVNLDEHLQRSRHGALTETEARAIFRQVVSAVDHCHRKWIVHRDIKTPNILLMKDGQIRLADFGLGNRFGHQRLKTLCGSMLYYSPEIFSGQRYTGPEVDCWCLGVTLFRMTAGFEPFAHARNPDQLKKLVISGQYPMPDTFSPGLQQTIRKCLSVDRRKRLGIRLALKEDAWLNDDGRLPDLFADTDRDYFPLTSDRERTRQRYLKDLEEEKQRGCHVKKTILYHPINPSIYFTSRSMHYTPYSRRDEVVQAQEVLQKELIKKVRAQLKQAYLQPLPSAEIHSPFHRLLRKLKMPHNHNNSHGNGQQQQKLKKTASTLSLSQLYQRVAKDQLTYYQIQGSESDMVILVRAACELLGITYRHDNPLRLTCVMTMHNGNNNEGSGSWFHGLRDKNKTKTAASSSTPMLNNQHSSSQDQQGHGSQQQQDQYTNASFATAATVDGPGQRSSLLSNNSTSTNRWSRTFKRLSMPFTHQQDTVMMPWSQSFQLHSSTQHYSSHHQNHHSQQQQQQQPSHSQQGQGQSSDQQQPNSDSSLDPEQEKESTVLFTIEAFIASNQVMGLRYSKLEGSAKVFKYAKGWITGVLAYNTESHIQQQQQP